MRSSKFQSLLLTTLASASVFFSGCGYGNQSAINSAGIQSERLSSLWWIFLGLTATVYVIVMAILIFVFFRVRRAGRESDPDIKPDQIREKKVANIIKGAVAV